jgi:cytochrome c peroxidase
MSKLTNERCAARRPALRGRRAALAILATSFAALPVLAQEPALPEPPAPPVSLTFEPVPLPPAAELAKYVRNTQVAIALGKAFFWDQQVGSDSKVACANCHYHAGADARSANTVAPGPNGVFEITSGPGEPLSGWALNAALSEGGDDIVGSQGVATQNFVSLVPGSAVETGSPQPNPSFGAHRQVTGRQAPSVINAIFNHRNFWDGRASEIFNGVSPFGAADANARIFQRRSTGEIFARKIALTPASAASQAVGPVLSGVEMSWSGKNFPLLGRKLLALAAPLASQAIAADDSVLGAYRHSSGFGLNVSYRALIQQAFYDKWWNSNKVLDLQGQEIADPGYSLMELNFSLFWGISIMLYESTLVSGQSPFDQFVEGNSAAMSDSAVRGLAVFAGKGKCVACHKFPLMTGATTNIIGERVDGLIEEGVIENMIMGDNRAAFYDNGFYNIGVRPTAEDLGVGANGPFGPFSFARRAQSGRDFCALTPNCKIGGNDRVAVDGAFKTPTLRNIELTGPYFHNGRYATLEDVVDFYQRGGNVKPIDPASHLAVSDDHSAVGEDTSGTGPLGNGGVGGSNLDPDIGQIRLNAQEEADLVAFLRALTDERVRWEMAPFDHPALELANSPDLEPVGAGGRAAAGLPPLKPFHEEAREQQQISTQL